MLSQQIGLTKVPQAVHTCSDLRPTAGGSYNWTAVRQVGHPNGSVLCHGQGQEV